MTHPPRTPTKGPRLRTHGHGAALAASLGLLLVALPTWVATGCSTKSAVPTGVTEVDPQGAGGASAAGPGAGVGGSPSAGGSSHAGAAGHAQGGHPAGGATTTIGVGGSQSVGGNGPGGNAVGGPGAGGSSGPGGSPGPGGAMSGEGGGNPGPGGAMSGVGGSPGGAMSGEGGTGTTTVGGGGTTSQMCSPDTCPNPFGPNGNMTPCCVSASGPCGFLMAGVCLSHPVFAGDGGPDPDGGILGFDGAVPDAPNFFETGVPDADPGDGFATDPDGAMMPPPDGGPPPPLDGGPPPPPDGAGPPHPP